LGLIGFVGLVFGLKLGSIGFVLHIIVSLELFARPRNDPVIWRSSKSVGMLVFIVNNCSHKGLRKKLLAKKKKRRVTRCERAGLGFVVHSYSPTGVLSAPSILDGVARLMRKKGLAGGGRGS